MAPSRASRGHCSAPMTSPVEASSVPDAHTLNPVLPFPNPLPPPLPPPHLSSFTRAAGIFLSGSLRWRTVSGNTVRFDAVTYWSREFSPFVGTAGDGKLKVGDAVKVSAQSTGVFQHMCDSWATSPGVACKIDQHLVDLHHSPTTDNTNKKDKTSPYLCPTHAMLSARTASLYTHTPS